MKTKLVNRYYCDFCHKGMCQKRAMIKHEAGCTMNPNRVCRIHAQLILNGDAQRQPKIKNLIHALLRYQGKPKPPESTWAPWDTDLDNTALDKGLILVKKLARGCPVCILATIRQARLIEPSCYVEYNFKDEMEKTLEELWPPPEPDNYTYDY